MTYKLHDDVGVILIEEDTICYSSPAPRLGEWRLPIAQLAIIGEFTTEEGPMWFDWYVAFVGSNAGWAVCPANAKGMSDVLGALRERLGCTLEITMYSSARFASRIMYPANSAEMPLLSFKPLPWSLWTLWKFWRFFQVSQELSDEAKAILISNQHGPTR